MSKNPLGMKRFGPVVLYVQDAEAESKRLAQLLNMKVTYQPSGEDSIFGIEANDVLFVLDSSPAALKTVATHGNFVQSLGIYVENSQKTLAEIQKRCGEHSGICETTGASFVRAPHDGDVFFRFLEDGQEPYPGIQRFESPRSDSEDFAFHRIDHAVTNTQSIKPVIEFFRDVFGMEKVNEFTIKVETEAFTASLYSEVMGLVGSEGEILFPVNEPLPGDIESQIPVQLKNAGRSHVQHVALATKDIISSIATLRKHGLGFLEFRNEEHLETYFQEVPGRLGKIQVAEALDILKSLGILVDKCGEGYLLQLFSKRLFPERSVPFIEIIQRASDVTGCFGEGNFAALAESLEHAMRQQPGTN